MSKSITSFEGKNAFLSNFYPSPIVIDGVAYPTVEHYYQAMKTENTEERRKIINALTPGIAKKLGRSVELRKDWEFLKVFLMYRGIIRKFTSHKDICDKLIATGTALLVEGNYWHDNFWGDCHCNSKIICLSAGKNFLGKILMDVRTSLQEGVITHP
jgi:ribA/ribD-fused uncharacterized protein